MKLINLDKPRAFVKKHKTDIKIASIYTMGAVTGASIAYLVMFYKIVTLEGEQIRRIDLFSSEDVPGIDFTLLLTKLNGTTEVQNLQDIGFPE